MLGNATIAPFNNPAKSIDERPAKNLALGHTDAIPTPNDTAAESSRRPLAAMYALERGLEGQPSSGSIATSRAASRHNSAGVRREPSSSKMRTSFRLRPSSTRTCSRAALALSERATTSLTPTLEVTVNFMAVRASHHAPKRNPRTDGSSQREAIVTAIALRQTSGRRTVNFLLLQGHAGLAERLFKQPRQ